MTRTSWLTKLQNLVVGLPADPPRLRAQPRPAGPRLSVTLKSLPPSCHSLRCSTKCTLRTPGFHPTSSAVQEDSDRLLLNHKKTLGFLASGGEEFNPGPETRLDHSELLCNWVLLKYKRDRESFWQTSEGGRKSTPLLVFAMELYTLQLLLQWIKRMSGGCKDLTRPTPIIYTLR